MPPKLRELIAELERAGFINRGGKGSHRRFKHPVTKRTVVISGNLGHDAQRYQEIDVSEAVKEVKGK
jgi:predicted RNA binding protein YcfA (HicA-like mRNA interferase family)